MLYISFDHTYWTLYRDKYIIIDYTTIYFFHNSRVLDGSNKIAYQSKYFMIFIKNGKKLTETDKNKQTTDESP